MEPQIAERSEGADVIPIRPAQPEKWDGGHPQGQSLRDKMLEVEQQLLDGRSTSRIPVEDETGKQFGFADVPVSWTTEEINTKRQAYARFTKHLYRLGERTLADRSADLSARIERAETEAEELDEDLSKYSPGRKLQTLEDLGDHAAFTSEEYGRVTHDLATRAQALRDNLRELEGLVSEYESLREEDLIEPVWRLVATHPEVEARYVETLASLMSGGSPELEEIPAQKFADTNLASVQHLRSRIQFRLNEVAVAYGLLKKRDADFGELEDRAYADLEQTFPEMRTRRPTVVRPSNLNRTG